jgi:hypothetical protein
MTSASAEPRGWSPGRWWAAVAMIFGLQVGLMLWLEDRSPVVPRKPAAAPVLRLTDRPPGAGLALEDPTLFALPHPHSFSGQAWLRIRSPEFHAPDLTVPVTNLLLVVEELGGGFATFVLTNPAPSFPTIVMPEPELRVPELVLAVPPSIPSTLRLEGDLAKRRLLSTPTLPSWTCTDLLTNSIVQVLVDAQGNAVSAVLLPPGSGLKDADQLALDIARAARFEAGSAFPTRVESPSPGLTIGTMVFQWQTLPVSASNQPPATP